MSSQPPAIRLASSQGAQLRDLGRLDLLMLGNGQRLFPAKVVKQICAGGDRSMFGGFRTIRRPVICVQDPQASGLVSVTSGVYGSLGIAADSGNLSAKPMRPSETWRTAALPPCSSAIARTIAKPSPLPPASLWRDGSGR